MRPVSIPDERVWEGGHRRVIAGPDGDLTGDIRPVEVIIDEDERYGICFNMMIELDKDDLEKLTKTPRFWLTIMSDHLHPFSLELDADQLEEGGQK